MMTLLAIDDSPLVTAENMHAVTARKWETMLAGILRGDECVGMLTPRGTWRMVRTVGDLMAFVRDGGEVW